MPDAAGPSAAAASLQIYVHCATSVEYLAELNASLPGVERYAERALLLAQEHDTVCVPDEVEPAYLSYLTELGLGPLPGNLLVASRFGDGDSSAPLWQRILRSEAALDTLGRRARRHSSTLIHPFIASRGQFLLAGALQARSGSPVRVNGGDPALVAYADAKHHIRARAIELGIPVAPGEVVILEGGGAKDEAEMARAIERQIRRTGRVIIRGTSGAAGSSTFAVERPEQIPGIAQRLAGRLENRIYLVEAMVQATFSPNIQMDIDPYTRAVSCAGMTDQRWERPLVHGGNRYPSGARRLPEMLGWARRIAEWLGSRGYVGLAGFDFVEYTDAAGVPQAILAEVNPRVNGATYPLRLMRRLNASQRLAGFPEVQAFTSGTVETEARTFADLREGWDERLFSPQRGWGLVPYAPGLIAHGKCGVVALAATRQEADDLYLETEAQAVAV